MSSVPQPYRPVDLIMGGASTLSQGLGERADRQRAEEQANAPIHPLLQQYVERLFRGEDPNQLATEARAHPDLAGMIDGRSTQRQTPNPAGYVPDVGTPGGQPSVMSPGAVSPSGGPQQSLGAMPQQGQIGRPQEAQAAPQPQFVSGATQPQPQMRGPNMMSGAAQPVPQGPPPGAPAGSLGNMQTAGSSFQQPQPPQMPPAAPAQQGPPQGQPMSNRQFAQVSPMMPALAAAQGRQQVAQTTADSRGAVAALNAEKSTLLAIMKENGLDSRAANSLGVALEGLDDRQQQAVLRATTDLMKAQIQASASQGAARIRADAPRPDPTEKELNTVIQQVESNQRVTDWQTQPELKASVEAGRARIDALRAQVGRPTGGPAAPTKAGPPPKAGGKTVNIKFPNGSVRPVPEASVQDAITKYGGKVVQ